MKTTQQAGTTIQIESGYDSVYRMRYPVVTEYDSKDRPVKTTLPDGCVQETVYEIANGQSAVTVIDPLGNISVQRTDARGNIVSVLRKDYHQMKPKIKLQFPPWWWSWEYLQRRLDGAIFRLCCVLDERGCNYTHYDYVLISGFSFFE